MKGKVNRVSIEKYKRDKKTLKGIFSFINHQVYFEKYQLPQFLWLASLREYFGEIGAHSQLHKFSSIFDNYYSPTNESFFDGTVCTFDLPSLENKKRFLSENKDLIDETILKPFRDIILLYPKIPMRWLIKEDDQLSKEEKKLTILKLEGLVSKLQDSKSDYTGNIRAMPLNQIFKHGKIHLLAKDVDLIKAIEEYPGGDRYRLQTSARIFLNMLKQEQFEKSDWPKVFWDYNLKLIKCDE